MLREREGMVNYLFAAVIGAAWVCAISAADAAEPPIFGGAVTPDR